MSEFGDAFAAARKAGKKVFTFGGKKYNTKLKGDGEQSQGKTTPVPQSKPSGKTPTPKARPDDGPNARRRPARSPKSGESKSGGPSKRPKVKGKEAPKAPAVGIARAGPPMARYAAKVAAAKSSKTRTRGGTSGGGGGF